jgi:hypothetical protein
VTQDSGGTHDGGTPADAPHPEVAEAVTHIRDRFGVDGLRGLIRLAQRELQEAEQALSELAAWEQQQEHRPADPGA